MITLQGLFVVFITWVFVLPISWLLSKYLNEVYAGSGSKLDVFLLPIENFIYRIIGVNPLEGMGWKEYFKALIYLNSIEAAIGFILLLFQGSLPLNPMHYSSLSWSLSFNTALSFASNTDLQHYAGETSLSYLSQMIVIQFLQFASAATGLSVGVSVIRGFSGRTKNLGNFYYDYIRSLTRVLIPLSLISTVILIWLGVPQSLSGYQLVNGLQPGIREIIYRGPIASLVSIMQLGTNGGGYFGINSAYPLQNPSQVSDIFEISLMMLIPTSLLFLFGRVIGNRKEARTLIIAAYTIYAINIIIAFLPSIQSIGTEVRLGNAASVFWTVTTTSFTTGSLNAPLSSFSPVVIISALNGMLVQGAPGGAGIGIMYLLMYVIVTIFLVGLMAGRTPEYLGMKIEGRDIKNAVAAFITHPLLILVPVALAFGLGAERAVGVIPSAAGFTKIFYEYVSAAANNGSDFLGPSGNTVFLNVSTGITMWLGRFIPMIFMLSLADGISKRKRSPVQGLRTDSISFPIVLVVSILILTVLTFFPFLVIGPVLQFLESHFLVVNYV
ncbi:MAG: potassium-transporting ATPase subunit KdpA [Thermoplasmatales archaeon]